MHGINFTLFGLSLNGVAFWMASIVFKHKFRVYDNQRVDQGASLILHQTKLEQQAFHERINK